MGFNREVFASKLRCKRAELGMSQAELAEKSGICSDAVFKYENGNSVPGCDKVCALAEVLGCTPNELMGWDDARGVSV